ncbi:hypothetical protein BU24DRAFT_201679 [Aaosphaeria arxii CBS 175.79]|uniref:Serine-rich protein n=1 Tax=Aaosphaeria arxii CBS 175.79 TaxID=1450172 RepID=A0A6A5XU47_9PLEO|nr:uncharacterized protein BU24DRAFT_201679 [Aaosphaeria arxii CBS 175.79]KAF2016439.1 hypothetical protein BU24DRAFT_201679 [Aaosphaeria arxii CBS 175.79]
MSSIADRGTSGHSSPSLSPLPSPLAHGPKFSPPKSRNTSPIRRPLHDRSNSQSNQHLGPTIRIVEDPGAEVYEKTPFPSQASQILPPLKKPGYSFEGRGSRVSDENQVAHAVAKIEASQTLVPKPLLHRKAIRHSTSTSISDADTLVASSFSPSSSRFSQGSTSPSEVYADEKGLEVLQENVPLPPFQPIPQSTIRAVPPSSSSKEDPLEGHALTPRASAASLASTASVDTLSPPPSSANWQAASQPSSSGTDHRKPASSTNQEPQRPTQKPSTESFAFSDSSSYSERPSTSSHPSPTIHAARQVSLSSGVRLHYPIVRAPSASSLRASSENLPSITSRMNNRASQIHQWSSQLSTIHSESDRGSRSIERSSRSFDARSQSQDYHVSNGRENIPRMRRQTVGSVSSSDNISTSHTESSSVAVPLPLFSPITGPSHEERDSSDERHDTISPLQSPPLRTKRSFLKRHDSDSRSSSSRPGSAQSDFSTFIANTIPPWARVYYRRDRNSLGAPDSATESTDSLRLQTGHSGRTNTPSEGNFPLSIYRPRNRPHQRMSHPETMSMSDRSAVEQEIYVIERPRRAMVGPCTPRLQKDRRSQARLSAWKAPSFDDSLGTLLFSRQNRQVWLFCLGFILPLAWMVASFLPLPPDPELCPSTPNPADIEGQYDRTFGPVDDRSYQKANWWRNLNRIMSAIGTLLIGVIIALAILASRMS